MHNFALLKSIAVLILVSSTNVFGSSVNPERFHADAQRREEITCSTFLKLRGWLPKKIIGWKMNIPVARLSIGNVSGEKFDSGEVRGLPSAPPIPEKNPDGTLKKSSLPSLVLLSSWFSEYEAFLQEMDTLIRGIGRYLGEPTRKDATHQSRNQAIDEIRNKGRIAILTETRDRIRNGESDPNRVFPGTIQLPRAPTRIGEVAVPEALGSILVDVNGLSLSYLNDLIRNDRYELNIFMKLAVKREVRQAELWTKIRQFRQAFSDNTVTQLREILGTGDQQAKTLANEKLKLIDRADAILNSREPLFIARRPSQRSLDLISEIIGTEGKTGLLKARHWEMEIRRYVNLASGWAALSNKKSTEIRNQVLLFVGVTTTIGMIWAKIEAVQDKVTDLTEQLRLNETELRQRAQIEDGSKIRSTVGVPANTYDQFFLPLNSIGQDRFDDASVTIAWQYYLELRPNLKPNPELDPDLDPKMYPMFEEQAQKFWEILMTQKHGLIDQKRRTQVPATFPRILRRELNLNLAKEAAARASKAAVRDHGWRDKAPVPRDPDAPAEGPIILPKVSDE